MRSRSSLVLCVSFFLAAGLASSASALPVLFVVAELGTPLHGDSYILPLEDPDQIAHARALIAQGPAAGNHIAVAAIAAGSDGVNRDVLAPGEPLWSWHVTGFEGFFDATAEILDGTPTMVEDDVDGWIANTGGPGAVTGFIGFWTYTVVAELPDVAEPAGAGALAGALAVLAGLRRRARAPLPRLARPH